ncbi:hypothetical protein Phum_PHUM079970 [Pediculus humanus corporis]|uniref:Uncharacterized protein n=1 Tax=Pediculus humanus subsp. corporis TaxID=121224 RepID=E0VC56_PEDHC|nr:uncharacterized protein Phum_PHUM079970 [Pediculus humanus corporis]EEB10962.1 hypothetical protein Phum_PHUM079970 [Pediculus humanus corporis]
MDTAVINFSESDSSIDNRSGDDDVEESYPGIIIKSDAKRLRDEQINNFNDDLLSDNENDNNINDVIRYGPDSDFDVNAALKKKTDTMLSNFVQDVEKEYKNSKKSGSKVDNLIEGRDRKFESNNSLDIDKELNDLMGTLCTDLVGKNCQTVAEPTLTINGNNCFLNNFTKNDDRDDDDDGSRVNLAYDEESENDDENVLKNPRSSYDARVNESYEDDYWKNQRIKSKSFVEKYKLEKLLKRGKQRMSMIELGSRYKKRGDKILKEMESSSSSSPCPFQIDNDFPSKPATYSCIGLAYDRSSMIEPKVSSSVSLNQRPQSEINGGGVRFSLESPSIVSDSNDSNPCSLSNRTNEDGEISPTHSKLSWQNDEEERMRNRSSSPRMSDTEVNNVVNSDCRVVESIICNEDMPCKPSVDDGGSSGVSSWLRQSMRRVRHFNLEDPIRIRSAPPDSLRIQVESDESESGVLQQNVINNRLNETGSSDGQQQQQQQTNRSSGNEQNRSQRRRTRSRPASLPGGRTRSISEATLVQQNQQQQQQIPETETTNSTPPASEAQDNLGYESDSTDRHPSPRG